MSVPVLTLKVLCRVCYSVIALLLCAPSLYGAGDSPTYAVEQLIAHGLVQDYIYAQRPFSHEEIKSFAFQADQSCRDPLRSCGPEIIAHIQQLQQWTEAQHNPRDLDSWSLQWQAQRQDTRQAPVQNGVGRIQAQIRPLNAYEQGRQWADGVTVGMEAALRRRIGRTLRVGLTPRLWMGSTMHPQRGNPAAGLDLLEAYASVHGSGMIVSLGRKAMEWGQSERGGLLLSRNARPLDALAVTSAKPFLHPWIFRFLGPSKYTVFAANLGNDREIAKSWMIGFAANARPHPNFEFGGYHTYILGGQGGPPFEAWDPITEFFFVRTGGIHRGSRNAADHRAGLNFRYTVPSWRYTSLYYEGIFEDLGRRNVWANFADVSGHIFGLDIPRMNAEGSLRGQFEYRFIPSILYRHGRFTDGYTLNDQLLGDPLGPNAQSVSASLRMRFSPSLQGTLRSAFEWRDSDTFTQTRSNQGGSNRVISIYNGPTEFRARAIASMTKHMHSRMRVITRGGYEHVWNHRFVNGRQRSNFMLGVTLQFGGFTPHHVN